MGFAIVFRGGLKCDCARLLALFLRAEILCPQQSLQRGLFTSALALGSQLGWSNSAPSQLLAQERAVRAMTYRKHLKPQNQTNKEENGTGGDNANLASSVI